MSVCFILKLACMSHLFLFILKCEGVPASVTPVTVYLWTLPPQRLWTHSPRWTASRTMRLPTSPATLGLMTLLMFTCPLFGSCHPVGTSEQHKLVFIEKISSPAFRFNWRNVTCPLCKVLFTIVDIALLVMFKLLFIPEKKTLNDENMFKYPFTS